MSMFLQYFPFSDLQFVARGHCGAGRGQGRPQDHRDQRAECGGGAPREDRQPAGHLCRGGEISHVMI